MQETYFVKKKNSTKEQHYVNYCKYSVTERNSEYQLCFVNYCK